jgi:hypothetical protein
MLQIPQIDLPTDATPQLKQVEFNTVTCAGGVHANIISDMHRQLVRTGAYETQSVEDSIELTSALLPPTGHLKLLLRDSLAPTEHTMPPWARPQQARASSSLCNVGTLTLRMRGLSNTHCGKRLPQYLHSESALAVMSSSIHL